MRRWSVGFLLIQVGCVALALASVREATEARVAWALTLMYAALVVATIGAAVRGRRGVAWAGFAIGGWSYFLPAIAFAHEIEPEARHLPTSPLLASYIARVNRLPDPPPGFWLSYSRGSAVVSTNLSEEANQNFGAFRKAYGDQYDAFDAALERYAAHAVPSMRMGHLAITLLIASAGSMLGRWLGHRRVVAPPAGSR